MQVEFLEVCLYGKCWNGLSSGNETVICSVKSETPSTLCFVPDPPDWVHPCQGWFVTSADRAGAWIDVTISYRKEGNFTEEERQLGRFLLTDYHLQAGTTKLRLTSKLTLRLAIQTECYIGQLSALDLKMEGDSYNYVWDVTVQDICIDKDMFHELN